VVFSIFPEKSILAKKLEKPKLKAQNSLLRITLLVNLSPLGFNWKKNSKNTLSPPQKAGGFLAPLKTSD
jgi:hypothetical protein